MSCYLWRPYVYLLKVWSIFGIKLGFARSKYGGMMPIASSRTEDTGVETRQGVRFYTLQCCCPNLICIVLCLYLRKTNAELGGVQVWTP
jgi:hypothetical protein